MAAQIYNLPSAAPSPVVQASKPGRRPKMVINLSLWHSRKRVDAEFARDARETAALIAEEVAMLRRLQEIDERVRADRARRLHCLVTPAKTAQEKRDFAEVLADIRWFRLPFAERQRIEALRAGRGAVLNFPGKP